MAVSMHMVWHSRREELISLGGNLWEPLDVGTQGMSPPVVALQRLSNSL